MSAAAADVNKIYYEWKYHVPVERVHVVLRILRSQFEGTDRYPVNEVGSYYFDSQRLASYDECIDGANIKRKFRLRSYSGTSLAQLQVKEKRIATVKKWKLNAGLLPGDFISWNELLRADELAQKPGAGDLAAAAARYGELYPTLDVRYTRHRFRTFDYRMNLDESIRFRAGPNLRQRVARESRLPFAVFEMKTTNSRPHLPLLGLIGLQSISFSKYAIGIGMLTGNPETLGRHL